MKKISKKTNLKNKKSKKIGKHNRKTKKQYKKTKTYKKFGGSTPLSYEEIVECIQRIKPTFSNYIDNDDWTKLADFVYEKDDHIFMIFCNNKRLFLEARNIHTDENGQKNGILLANGNIILWKDSVKVIPPINSLHSPFDQNILQTPPRTPTIIRSPPRINQGRPRSQSFYDDDDDDSINFPSSPGFSFFNNNSDDLHNNYPMRRLPPTRSPSTSPARSLSNDRFRSH